MIECICVKIPAMQPFPSPENLAKAAEITWDARWSWQNDMNGDGLVTISDVGAMTQWIFFAPGDWLLLMWMMHEPRSAFFCEITPSMLSGFLSGAMSAVVWLIVFALWEHKT